MCGDQEIKICVYGDIHVVCGGTKKLIPVCGTKELICVFVGTNKLIYVCGMTKK